MHGRPVTKHADIQPVAHEYQRYKVSVKKIKKIIIVTCIYLICFCCCYNYILCCTVMCDSLFVRS